MNQLRTNDSVISNWLSDIPQNSTTGEFISNIDETYLPMVDEGYFGGCLYLKTSLKMMLCMKMEVAQELN